MQIVALMISTIRLAENEIQRRVTVSLKLAIFWIVKGLSKDFTVRFFAHGLVRNGVK